MKIIKKDHFYDERVLFVQILLNGVYRNDCLYYSGLCTTRNALSREWLYKTVGTYVFLSRYLMPIYNIYPNMWVSAISTFYYLIIAIHFCPFLQTKYKSQVFSKLVVW